MLEVTAPGLYSLSAKLPFKARDPLQPSPDTPPLAVQLVAPGTLHVRVTRDPVVAAVLLAENITGCHRPSSTKVPDACGSRTELRVAEPVVLRGSAVESKIPDRAVASAVAVCGDGAGGGTTGQTPGLSGWLLCARPRTMVPTNRLLGS